MLLCGASVCDDCKDYEDETSASGCCGIVSRNSDN